MHEYPTCMHLHTYMYTYIHIYMYTYIYMYMQYAVHRSVQRQHTYVCAM